MSSPARSTPSRLLALLIAGACALTSCGGDDDAPPDPPSSSPTTTSPEAEVESAYLAYWDMAERLSAEPDPSDPEISQRSIDPVRSTLTDSLTTYRNAAQAVRSGPQYRHEITDVLIEGDQATVIDCASDDSALISAQSGETIEQQVVTSSLEAVLVRPDGDWLVKEINEQETWEGIVPCAA